MEHNNYALELKNVTKAYGGLVVLESSSLIVPAGDFVGVIGPNGGGKTTLIKLLLGLQEPTSGTVEIFGHSVADAKRHYEIGYVPQNVAQADALFPATVREVVESGRTARRGAGLFWKTEDETAVQRALELTDLTRLSDRLIGRLSGGERQRAFIARALAAEPKILFLDEPTVGVDVSAQAQFQALLQLLNTQEKMTIIMVSHDVDAVAEQVQTVVCVNKRVSLHTSSESFDKQAYMESVYGAHAQAIHHHHS